MTLEELQAQIQELQASNESMANKNKELLNELKTTRAKVKEIDIDSYYKLVDEVEILKSEKSKLDNESKMKLKEFEKLQQALSEKDNHLQKLIIDDGLTNNLTQIGVKSDFLPAVKALLRGQTEMRDNQAYIGDKPLNEFIAEWASNDGKAYIQAQVNNGGGANGSNSSQAITGKLDGSKSEQLEYIKQKFNL